MRYLKEEAAVSAAVDPEEMFVAALSTCHMLTFLHIARLAGFHAAAYRDQAEGRMEEIAPGKQAVTNVKLQPRIEWVGPEPDEEKLKHMHHEAHETCFIANSIARRSGRDLRDNLDETLRAQSRASYHADCRWQGRRRFLIDAPRQARGWF
jgi:organic hydroperoxide reductase OsmC/OhrA